ncbi:MAG: SdpI family protein [Deltaproteobacteria bacterium]|nr:SdpI family protein [Deltaproteobacteria bacterium]
MTKKIIILVSLCALQLPFFIYSLFIGPLSRRLNSAMALAAAIIITGCALYDLFKVRPQNPNRFDKHYISFLALPLGYLLFIQLCAQIGLKHLAQYKGFHEVAGGAFLVLFGNVFPRVPLGSSMGLKLRMIMKSETIWRKTHRLLGILFVLCGLVIIALGFVSVSSSTRAALVGGSFFVALAVVTVYGYRLNAKATSS